MITSLIAYVERLDKLTFFRQSLFGLSWMVSSSLLALQHYPSIQATMSVWFYLFCAFFSARSAGMCLNRLIDRYIDAQNPRTRERPLPRGEISVEFVCLQVVVFLSLFFFAAFKLGLICFLLSLFVGLLLCSYSYMKRYTIFCHFVLGSVHFLVPITCWIAFSGQLSLAPVLLGLSLLCSIAASDILYACQDVAFDRTHSLKSIPARFGISKAQDIAKSLHCMAVLFLVFMSDFCQNQKLVFFASCAVGIVYYLCYKRLSSYGYEKSFLFANTYSGLVFFLVIFTEYFLCHVL